MDLLTFLVVVYTVVVGLLFATAFFLRSRGKLSRAFFITGLTGIVVVLLVYHLYPSLVPQPVESPPPIDPHKPILPQTVDLLYGAVDAFGRAAGYEIGRVMNPFIYGGMAMIIAFPFSFLIPSLVRPKNSNPALQPAS